MAYSIELTADFAKDDSDFVFEALRQYNLQHAEDDNHQWLRLFVRDETGGLIAGLLGGTNWHWLHIDILWVREDCRKLGLGKQLMARAEAEAMRRGCQYAMVDTMDFQAPDFYRQLGYSVWGVLEDVPPGHRRIFFRKTLISERNEQA